MLKILLRIIHEVVSVSQANIGEVALPMILHSQWVLWSDTGVLVNILVTEINKFLSVHTRDHTNMLKERYSYSGVTIRYQLYGLCCRKRKIAFTLYKTPLITILRKHWQSHTIRRFERKFWGRIWYQNLDIAATYPTELKRNEWQKFILNFRLFRNF